jgi:hypothetical protein
MIKVSMRKKARTIAETSMIGFLKDQRTSLVTAPICAVVEL